MGTYGAATVQTLYTLFGVANPNLEPSLRRQVEHRSLELSRRGFLGLMGAGTAGLLFLPDTKLWTPVAAGDVTVVEADFLPMVAREFAAACDRVYSEWATRWRPKQGVFGRGDVAVRRILWNAPTHQLAMSPQRFNEIARGQWGASFRLGETTPFNEAYPLAVQAFEHAPDVRVADCLSPEQGILARCVEYTSWDVWQKEQRRVIDFEIAGYYQPNVFPVAPVDGALLGARARRRTRQQPSLPVYSGKR